MAENRLVWAKMPGFPYWPGRKCNKIPNGEVPPTESSILIYFFGSDDRHWVDKRYVKPYVELPPTPRPKSRKVKLIKAIKEVDEYIKDPKIYIDLHPAISGESDSESSDGPDKDEGMDISVETFGFIEVDSIINKIMRHLIESGKKVIVWGKQLDDNIDPNNVVSSPFVVMEKADYIFCSEFHPLSLKELANGANRHFKGKAFIQMRVVDVEVSQNISEAISSLGGQYLEALPFGSQAEINNGNVTVLAAGHKNLLDFCKPCFTTIAKRSYFLGDVGNAIEMYLVIKSFIDKQVSGLKESLNKAKNMGMNMEHIMDLIEGTSYSSPYLIETGKAIINGTEPTSLPSILSQYH